jgi:hypothetical protein
MCQYLNMSNGHDTEATAVTDSRRLNSRTAPDEQLWSAIRTAKDRLISALEAEPVMAKVHTMAALSALRGIAEE